MKDVHLPGPMSIYNELLELLLIGIAIIDFRQAPHFERLGNLMFITILIWCAFCTIEVFNDTCGLGIDIGGWYTGTRMMAFQLLYACIVFTLYINNPDKLMKYLGRDYYVSHLSAAALNGAAHQRAMVFQTTVNGGPIRSGIKNGTRLEFFTQKQMPMSFVNQVKTQMGYMNVASPELTALDLVADEKRIGGLSRVAELLMELSYSLQWDSTKLPLLAYFSIATIQRLGFILEQIGEPEMADALFFLTQQTNRAMRKTWLKQSRDNSAEIQPNNRWKILENYILELDEL